MDSIYIALAVPFFFALIGAEWVVSRRRGRALYRFADTLTNLGCGIGQQLFQIAIAGLLVGGYVSVYEHSRLFDVPMDAPWAWAAVLLGVDFAYYWFHRASHRVNVAWAAHAVHHQSEEYNLSVALRQSALQGLFSVPFYLPLAIVGVSPAMTITAGTINTLYQFWIHTRLVGRLGPLEWVLNTPSHHRVHHGVNPKCIDKNHGGMLIVWDRLFGTFQEEEEEPTYGTVKPLASWNPVWANIAPWVHLLSIARRTVSVRDRLRLFLMPPEWQPEDLGGPVSIPEPSRVPREAVVSRSLLRYAVVSFVPVTIAATILIAASDHMPSAVVVCLAFFVVATLVGLSGLFERKRWALPLEVARHAVLLPIGILLVWTWVFGS